MNVFLVANSIKSDAYAAMQSVNLWLNERGISSKTATANELTGTNIRATGLAQEIQKFDLVCCFGGDGTILRTAHAIGVSGVPLLGINYGELGFLTGTSADLAFVALEAFLANEIVAENRCLLKAKVSYANGKTDELLALNELVVGRGDQGRAIRLMLGINGDAILDFRGDGLIVATATGSTAYALSAGGPIVSPTHRGLCVVPLNPHSLHTRSIVTGQLDCVEVQMPDVSSRGIMLWLDGQTAYPLDTTDEQLQTEIIGITVLPASEQLTLLRYDAPAFYERAANAFFKR
ncbi:MAG: NAD(+)/NADH kinase [Coriobacteriales bacterium]|nr:NAD(+)/NADH kinase [Coriobacteriales bacterium]